MNAFKFFNTLSWKYNLLLRGRVAIAFLLVSLLSFTSFTVLASLTLPTKGEQKTLVLLVNFQENPNEQPLTLTEAESLVFGKVNDFYLENSFGQTWFSGQVAGWFTLPLSNQVCSLSQVRDLADQQAISAGVPLANYDRIVYLMTKTACGISGSASMEGTPSRAYINGSFTAKTIAHELGHNFGLHHSRALDCGDQTWSDQCISYEYGDTYDVMGGPDIGYFNTFQKEQLGWLEGDYGSKTVEVTQDGTYAIANYETQSKQPVTLKIPRSIDPATGTMRWFYIEYRQSVGFDDFLDSRSYSFYRGDVTEGVIIRSATEGDARSSNLLHLKTDSEYRALTGSNDWFDPAMPVGGSYTDPISGVTLSLISAGNGEAQVSVIFGDSSSGGMEPGGNTCTTSAPGLDAVAMTENAVAAGETVNYLVTVTNRDSADCANADFDLSVSAPAGWISTSEKLTLAPGEIGQVVLSVVSSTDAVPNDYSLEVVAAHGQDSDSTTTALLIYRVTEDSSLQDMPIAMDDNVVIAAKEAVDINALANDIIDEQATVSVISFTQPSKGRLELLADGSFRYTPERKFKSSDSFSYTISDGNGSSTAWVSITLQSSSDGSSGSGSKPGKGNNK